MGKRLIFRAAGRILLGLLIFWLGPFVGQWTYRMLTPASTIAEWRSEFRRLDCAFPRTAPNETRPLDLCRRLAQRGIYVDAGLRDEAIEHHITPRTIFIRGCWRWREFWGR